MDWFERNKPFLDKVEKLFKGKMVDYSKIVKVLQYVCVLTSEYDLQRYCLRDMGFQSRFDGLIGGERIKDPERVLELKLRWKKLGSAFSTARMLTRMGDFVD